MKPHGSRWGRRHSVFSALVLLAVMPSCSFMRSAPRDSSGLSYDELSALIDDTQQAREAGMSFPDWIKNHPMVADPVAGSWDLALGELHARRAGSQVREAPVGSLTCTWVAMLSSDYRRNSNASGIGYVLALVFTVPLCVPCDVILVPTSFVASCIQDMGVDADARRRALQDVEEARRLGFEPPDLWMR